jgi:NTE family protein
MSAGDDAAATPRIAFALQGGGAHGALSWGILDRLLEEPAVEFLGASGTSAGAMNAVLLADGIVRGGPPEARRQLRRFWECVGRMPGFGSLLGPMSGEAASRLPLEYTPAFAFWDAVSRNLSPYDLNPWHFNPLRAPLEEMIDFERLRAQSAFQVMVCATNVRTAGNPAMAPLIPAMPARDFFIVRSVHDILDRVREIGFNSSFWFELSAAALLLRLVDEGFLPRERFGKRSTVDLQKLLDDTPFATFERDAFPGVQTSIGSEDAG